MEWCSVSRRSSGPKFVAQDGRLPGSTEFFLDAESVGGRQPGFAGRGRPRDWANPELLRMLRLAGVATQADSLVSGGSKAGEVTLSVVVPVNMEQGNVPEFIWRMTPILGALTS